MILRSTTGHRYDGPVLQPQTCEEVVQVVRDAYADGRAIYPVSTGRNWGYGSAIPPHADCVVLDLSALRAIRNLKEISARNPVAVIEPGVTQGQLYEALSHQAPDLYFNVTGSAAETSILGNGLDRGVGYLGPRREDLFGLEVVTGTGEKICTGFRRLGEHSPLAHTHPYGLGPMLDGLFFQGNFGVVTSACFKLLPRPEKQLAVSLSLKQAEHLDEFIERLAALKRAGVVSSVTHIANKARTHATLMHGISKYLQERCQLPKAELGDAARDALNTVAPFEWTSLGGVSGTAAMVHACLQQVKASLGGLCRIQLVSERKLRLARAALDPFRRIPFFRANAAAVSAIMPLHGLAVGIPTDVAIANLCWKFDQEDFPILQLDDTRVGLLFINPALPMNGVFVRAIVDEMERCARAFEHVLYITLNIETPTSLVAVINLLFDRTDPAALRNAQECATALYALIKSKGLEVYRARVDMMGGLVDDADPYWQAVRELKRALDPKNIIAPGRYGLD